MTCHPLKANILRALAVCLTIGTLFGCANEIALLRPGAVKTYTVHNTDYNTAFTQAVQTAKELQFKISREDKDSGKLITYRGYGYGESSYLWIEVKKVPSGNVSITLDAKSSGGSEKIINEFMTTYNKYVKAM